MTNTASKLGVLLLSFIASVLISSPASASSTSTSSPQAVSTAFSNIRALHAPYPYFEPPWCPYASGHPTLRQGDRAIAVTHLQCLLSKHWGFGIDIDGIFGAHTKKIVMAAQDICDIAEDGIVGTVTWYCIHYDPAGRTASSDG